MNIFITGTTGFVGSAVTRELRGAGHQVFGLVRTAEGAASVAHQGVTPVIGSLEDLGGLTRAAAAADAVIHTAFNHDFTRFAASCEDDRRVVQALGAALEGSARPLVVTSALGVLPRGVPSTEETAPATGDAAHPRRATEEAADEVARRGVRVAVVRLPPSTHGPGDPHFMATLVRVARARGASAFIDAGDNRWPAVHRLDAARLFRLAAEQATPGARYHAVAEEGLALRTLAEAIARRLGVPTRQLTHAEATTWFNGFARFATLDVPSSSTLTRQALGWRPVEPTLLEDLAAGHYD